MSLNFTFEDSQPINVTLGEAVNIYEGDGGGGGSDGREIELRTNATHIQWRYVGDSTWTNLIELTDLKGDPGNDGNDGSPGADGREVELQVTSTHIQWRYEGGEWANLVALADLKGDKGDPGNDGSDGAGVAAGGTTGQVLAKKSNTDYDTEWVDQTGGGGGVTDHGALSGLSDDDHTQYALADGSRGSFATTAQGAKADTAVQPDDLDDYALASHNHDSDYAAISHDHDTDYAALSHNHDDRYYTEGEVDGLLEGKQDAASAFDGDYDSLTNKPTLGSAAAADTTDFATAAQGDKADTALQNITGLISEGTNITITGSGTAGSPYLINSSGNGDAVVQLFLIDESASNPVAPVYSSWTDAASAFTAAHGIKHVYIKGEVTANSVTDLTDVYLIGAGTDSHLVFGSSASISNWNGYLKDLTLSNGEEAGTNIVLNSPVNFYWDNAKVYNGYDVSSQLITLGGNNTFGLTMVNRSFIDQVESSVFHIDGGSTLNISLFDSGIADSSIYGAGESNIDLYTVNMYNPNLDPPVTTTEPSISNLNVFRRLVEDADISDELAAFKTTNIDPLEVEINTNTTELKARPYLNFIAKQHLTITDAAGSMLDISTLGAPSHTALDGSSDLDVDGGATLVPSDPTHAAPFQGAGIIAAMQTPPAEGAIFRGAKFYGVQATGADAGYGAVQVMLAHQLGGEFTAQTAISGAGSADWVATGGIALMDKTDTTGKTDIEIILDEPNEDIIGALVQSGGGADSAKLPTISFDKVELYWEVLDAYQPPTRETATVTTESLAQNAAEETTASMAIGYRLLKVETDIPARVQVYATEAQRTADSAREIGVDPEGNHGVILDVVTTEEVLALDLSPQVDGSSMEDEPSASIPIRVTNLDDSTDTVTVTFTWIATEVA